MDLKGILDDNEEPNKNIKVYKKPVQLKDIERRSKTNSTVSDNEKDINEYIDNEKNNIYNKPWSKLNHGSKLNRLKLHINILEDKYTLSKEEKNDVSLLLINALKKSKLNKVSELIYDPELGEIQEIKALSFNEETRKFTLKTTEQKHKPKKSKSNIDKLLR